MFEPSLPSTASEETGRGSLTVAVQNFFNSSQTLVLLQFNLDHSVKHPLPIPLPITAQFSVKTRYHYLFTNYKNSFPNCFNKKTPHPFMQTPDSVSNVDYLNAWNLIRNYETSLYHSFKESMNPSLNRTFSLYLAERFNDSINWLERDAIYSTNIHKTEDWQYWPKIDKYLYGDITENINSSESII